MNGAQSAAGMRACIQKYRKADPNVRGHFPIGCRILTQPFFFGERDWFPPQKSWSLNIVKFKTYNTGNAEGMALWDAVNDRLTHSQTPGLAEAPERFGEPRLICPRLGQGVFRVLATDI